MKAGANEESAAAVGSVVERHVGVRLGSEQILRHVTSRTNELSVVVNVESITLLQNVGDTQATIAAELVGPILTEDRRGSDPLKAGRFVQCDEPTGVERKRNWTAWLAKPQEPQSTRTASAIGGPS